MKNSEMGMGSHQVVTNSLEVQSHKQQRYSPNLVALYCGKSVSAEGAGSAERYRNQQFRTAQLERGFRMLELELELEPVK